MKDGNSLNTRQRSGRDLVYTRFDKIVCKAIIITCTHFLKHKSINFIMVGLCIDQVFITGLNVRDVLYVYLL